MQQNSNGGDNENKSAQKPRSEYNQNEHFTAVKEISSIGR